MKRMMSLFVGSLMVASFAGAADTEKKESDTTDHSKNPITGTETTTHKYKKTIKDEHGQEAKVDVKEKVKHMKNGKTKKSVEVDGEAVSK